MHSEINPMSKEHFQYLKGLAILAVMVGHIGNFSGKTWFTPLGGIGVALFLFCSGFGLTKSYQKNGLKHFWRNKLISVYFPFVAVELITAVAYKRTAINVLLELLFIKMQHPYGWYLQYLLVCYVLFYLGMRFIEDTRIRYVIWGTVAASTFVFCSNLRGEQAISFLAGILLAEYLGDAANMSLGRRHAFAGGGLLILSVCLLAVKQLPIARVYPHVYTLLNLLLKTSCAAGLLLISGYKPVMKRIVCQFGVISYALYLVHGYFMWIVSSGVTGFYLLDAVLMLAVSLATAWVLTQLISFLKKRIR